MAVAQLVESRIVIPVVVGSSPIGHPTLLVRRDSDYFGLGIFSSIGNILDYRFGLGAGKTFTAVRPLR